MGFLDRFRARCLHCDAVLRGTPPPLCPSCAGIVWLARASPKIAAATHAKPGAWPPSFTCLACGRYLYSKHPDLYAWPWPTDACPTCHRAFPRPSLKHNFKNSALIRVSNDGDPCALCDPAPYTYSSEEQARARARFDYGPFVPLPLKVNPWEVCSLCWTACAFCHRLHPAGGGTTELDLFATHFWLVTDSRGRLINEKTCVECAADVLRCPNCHEHRPRSRFALAADGQPHDECTSCEATRARGEQTAADRQAERLAKEAAEKAAAEREATARAAAAAKAAALNAPVTLGTNERNEPLTLDRELRNRHLYAIGKTRSGKTTLLKNLARADLIAGRGLCFIDPHGDAVTDLLGHVPPERAAEVVYFCPSDEDAPAFNLLAMDFAPYKLAEDVLSAFKMFFGESWGPRLEHLLRFSLLTLTADAEPHSVADIKRLLLDAGFRAALTERATNEQIRSFWLAEYPAMSKDAGGPILNKLSAMLAPMSPMEHVFGTTANALDVRRVMDTGGVLLVNLAKGELGDGPSRFVGGLIATAITQAALARSTLPQHQRRDFFLYVDEFHNYTVASFETILSEAAKYRLNLALANQTLAQLPPSLQHAIFGNVGTLAAFAVSADDASRLQREMARPRYRDPVSGHAHDPDPETVARLQGDVATDALDRLRWDIAHPGMHYGHKPQPQLGTLGDWPNVDDFVNLKPLHAFVRVLRPENTTTLAVPFPPDANEDLRAAVLTAQRDRHEAQKRPPTSPASSHGEARPHRKPQDERNAPDADVTPHQEPTTFDDAPGSAVHSPVSTTTNADPDTIPRPQRRRRLPQPPRPD